MREEVPLLGRFQYLLAERLGYLTIQEPVAVLAEGREHPDGVIRVEAH